MKFQMNNSGIITTKETMRSKNNKVAGLIKQLSEMNKQAFRFACLLQAACCFSLVSQKVLRVSFLFLLITVFFSCNSEQLDDCFTKTGADITEERPAEYFHSIELYNNVNLVLVPGNTPFLEIKGGENLLPAIKTEIKDSTLIIRNTLKCNWTRSFDREITVYATAPALREIRYEGSGDIKTSGQIKLDSLQLNIWGGAGSFELDLDVSKLKLAMHYGTVDLTVKGKALITTIFANSYGPFYCNELISNIAYVRNSGTNQVYVYAKHILEVEIASVGDIFYYGNPYDLKSNITGSGKLVKGD
jgi:hypothetical protein